MATALSEICMNHMMLCKVSLVLGVRQLAHQIEKKKRQSFVLFSFNKMYIYLINNYDILARKQIFN